MIKNIKHETASLLKVGLPIIAAQLAQMLMGFTDTVMAGNLGANDLAAVAVGSNLILPLFLFSMGVLMAVNPLVAHEFGAGNVAGIGPVVRQSLLFSQVLAVLNIIINNHLEWAPAFIGIEPHLHAKSIGYLKAFSFGIPASMALLTLRFANDGLGNTKPGMLVSFIALPFNVLFNWIFMYGKFGFPAMGAVGTGWATALVNWIQFFVMLTYCVRSAKLRPYGWFKNDWKPEFIRLKELMRIGLPSGLSFGLEVSMFALVSLMVGKLGTQAIASHQIAMNFSSITFMVALGLSTAITIRVGQFTGAGEHAKAAFSGRVGIGLAAGVMSLFGMVMMAVPKLIASIYTADKEVIVFAGSLLQLAAIFQIFDGLQVSGSGALRGLKDTKIPMIVNFIAYWLIGLNLGYWLGLRFGYGAQGMWIGLIAGLTFAGIMHNVRFNYLIEKKAGLLKD